MPGATVATTLNENAALTPRAISVNMLRLPVMTERAPRTRNGQPHHSTTGGRQNQFHPRRHMRAAQTGQPFLDRQTGHRAHGHSDQWDAQYRTDEKTPRKIDQFGVWAGIGGRYAHWFQCHATDRAAAGAFLYDFGVHRTGKHGAGRRVGCRFKMRTRQVMLRVGGKAVATALTAEMIGLDIMIMTRFSR